MSFVKEYEGAEPDPFDANITPLLVRVENVPTPAEEPPIVAPSIVPPFMSTVVTDPKLVQVALAAVGAVSIVGEVKVLFVKVSIVARPTKVSVVAGSVRIVSLAGFPPVKAISLPSLDVPSK